MNKLMWFLVGVLWGYGCLARAAEPCVERNLAHFYSHHREVKPTIVGKSAKCDNFGGAYVETKDGIYIYVNFNLPARVNLDIVDQELAKRTPAVREFYKNISVAVVDKESMRRWFGEAEYSLNWAGNIFFISETLAARPGALDKLFHEFFGFQG